MAIGLLLLCALLPLPGVHQLAALHQLGRATAWWARIVGGWPPGFSALSMGLGGLVFARLGLGLILAPDMPATTARTWRTGILTIYVFGSALTGVAMGLTLAERFPDLVTTDALLLATLDAATFSVVAVFLWALADLVRKSGVASGSLLLFGAWEAVRMTRFALELLAAAEAGEVGLMPLAFHLGTLPAVLILVALWRWEPGPLPLPVGRALVLRSPVDLIVVPMVIGAVAATIANDLSGFPSWTPQPPLYDPGLVSRTLGGLLVVPALGWWMRSQPGHRGTVGWAVVALGLLLLTGALVLLVALS